MKGKFLFKLFKIITVIKEISTKIVEFIKPKKPQI